MFLLALLACASDPAPGGGGPGSSTEPSDTTVGTTADTGVSLLALVGEADFHIPEGSVALLVGEVTLTTTVPAVATLRIDGPCGRDEVVFEEATNHVLPVLGLHHAADHQLSVVLEGAGEELVVDLGTVTTPVLPDLPPAEAHVHRPEAMEPGLRVVTPYHSDTEGWVVAFDEQLHVVYALPRNVGDLTHRPDGTWLVEHLGAVVAWDVYGRELHTWTDGDHPLHHEAFALEDGGALSVSGGVVVEPDYPDDASLQTTSEHEILAQELVRFDPTGAIVERHSMADLLDTTHVGFLSVRGADPQDWSHVNSVVPWDDDGWLVSVRHLDVVACVGHDGQLRWLLGDPAGWEEPWASAFLAPTDPGFRWQRHQHALEVHDEGVVVMFDNGNHQGSPYAPAPEGTEPVSTGLAVRIDEDAGTFEEVFRVGHDGLFSPGQGDADLLPLTGHVQLVFSMVGLLPVHSRIVELDPYDPTDVALDVTIGGDRRRFVYRAEVLPSLYPERLTMRRGMVPR